jgi:uncharacterized protein YqjF (DUF2071 family)
MTYLPNAAFRRPRGWIMAMAWDDLLFMHWPVEADALRARLPAGLELDTFDGAAWLAVVPFRMSGTRPRFIPRLPGLSDFPELNVRTYVRRGGLPGVWFFSLDAGNPFAVRGARRFFHLPYFDAEMRVGRAGPEADAEIAYASRRTHAGAPAAEFRARYAPAGPAYKAAPGTLDDWLTARYCLYAADGEGHLLRCDIHHRPWRLQPARADVEANTMAAPLGLDLTGRPPLLHFAARTEVVAWLPEFVC